MQCVLKYFLNKDYSLGELDKLTKRKAGLWTWISQMALALHDLGLDIKLYSKTDLEPFLEGEPFIRKHFGADAGKILKFADLPVAIESIRKVMSHNLFEKRKFSFNEIERHIKQGHVPLMLIDHNKLIGKKGPYQGHLAVLTGFDKQNVFYHESGPKKPEANKRIPKKTFMRAWNANGTDNDVIIVFGKR